MSGWVTWWDLNFFHFEFPPIIAVQFRGKAPGSEGKLDEAATGGDYDQDGGARQGVHEGQTEGDLPSLDFIWTPARSWPIALVLGCVNPHPPGWRWESCNLDKPGTDLLPVYSGTHVRVTVLAVSKF